MGGPSCGILSHVGDVRVIEHAVLRLQRPPGGLCDAGYADAGRFHQLHIGIRSIVRRILFVVGGAVQDRRRSAGEDARSIDRREVGVAYCSFKTDIGEYSQSLNSPCRRIHFEMRFCSSLSRHLTVCGHLTTNDDISRSRAGSFMQLRRSLNSIRCLHPGRQPTIGAATALSCVCEKYLVS